MPTIRHVQLDPDQLWLAPEKDTVFFLGIANLADELIALQKLLNMTNEFRLQPDAKQHAQIAFATMFLRLLVGKLHEGWEFLQGSFFGSGLSAEYDNRGRLNTEAQEALDNIKRYFSSSSNVLSDVRNHHAFHYSPSKARDAIPELGADDRLDLYVGEGPTNTLFYFSETLNNIAMLRGSKLGDSEERALQRILEGAQKTAFWFLRFANGFIWCFLSDHPAVIRQPPLDEIKIQGPNQNSLELPWFVEV